MSRYLKDPSFIQAHLTHKMTAQSGLSLQEMVASRTEDRAAALDAMAERRIERPRIYPDANFKVLQSTPVSGQYLLSHWAGKGANAKPIKLRIMDEISLETLGEEKLLWWHVSLSREDGKMPTYSDIARVRSVVMGNRWCVQYFPPSDRYVNDHPTCLHLWHCLEKEVMPDFRRFGTI